MKKLLLLAVLLYSSLVLHAQQEKSSYSIAKKIALDGDFGWDYLTVDDATERLFLSHGNMVQVVDLTTGKLAGTITDTKGVHGIALAPELNKGFISDGQDSSVTVFDYKTLAFIEKISVTGRNPDCIMYDSFSKQVFTYNGRSANATVIDATTNKVKATIPLAGKPEFSVTDGRGKVYVNIEDKSMVSVINTKTLKVENTWSIAPGEEPSGLALDNTNHRLFMVCGNKLMTVVNAQTGKVITTLPIGEGVDGVAYDAQKKRIYSSNGEGTMTVVQQMSANKYKVLENVPTQRGARTITLDKKTHHLYLPTAQYGPAPAATADNPRPRPKVLPGTFVVLDIQPEK